MCSLRTVQKIRNWNVLDRRLLKKQETNRGARSLCEAFNLLQRRMGCALLPLGVLWEAMSECIGCVPGTLTRPTQHLWFNLNSHQCAVPMVWFFNHTLASGQHRRREDPPRSVSLRKSGDDRGPLSCPALPRLIVPVPSLDLSVRRCVSISRLNGRFNPYVDFISSCSLQPFTQPIDYHLTIRFKCAIPQISTPLRKPFLKQSLVPVASLGSRIKECSEDGLAVRLEPWRSV